MDHRRSDEQFAEQQVFDLSARHVIKQGKPSLNNNPLRAVCRYRSTNTTEVLGCGMAPFIINYSPHMEGLPITSLMRRFPTWLDQILNTVSPALVVKLQEAHDRAAVNSTRDLNNPKAFIDLYKSNMASLAEEFDLNQGVLS